MSKVINRKNVVIAHDFSNQASFFNKTLNLSFQPDTMVVKLINAIGNQLLEERIIDVYLIYCTNLNEYIGSFFDGSTSTPNLTFNVSNSTINTEWKFESHNYDGTVESDSLCEIVIHLEFLQHEK